MKFGLNFNCACVNWNFGKELLDSPCKRARSNYENGQFSRSTAQLHIRKMSTGIACSSGQESAYISSRLFVRLERENIDISLIATGQ